MVDNTFILVIIKCNRGERFIHILFDDQVHIESYVMINSKDFQRKENTSSYHEKG